MCTLMIVMKAYAVRRARTSIEMIPLHNINPIQQKTNGQIYQENKGKEQPKTTYSTPISTKNICEPSIEPLAPRTSKIAALFRISEMKKP